MNIGRRYLSSRSSISRLGSSMPTSATSDLSPGPYSGWTREQLIERLMQLEAAPSADATLTTDESTISAGARARDPIPPPAPKIKRNFDFSKYSQRKIALKLCYSGWEYGGLAFQTGPTPLPTVENVLYDALCRSRLIDPEAGFEGSKWEKCGRTDRGVSAAGQVVSFWIRSSLPSENTGEDPPMEVKEPSKGNSDDEETSNLGDDLDQLAISIEPSSNSSLKKASREAKEHDYLGMINRLLPDTIRVLAWSPVPASFSARFSCKYRHYKYFFSSLHLDIPAMQAAAARMIGEHDFRNFCKLDPQKQITSFRRVIMRATIKPLEGDENRHGHMHVFDLMGSAFLYHQVRHIMAILFLVGSGLEPPSVVTELLNVREGAEPLRPEDEGIITKYAVVDRKPEYIMADALPLMLWKCGYDESIFDWRTSNATDRSVIVRGGLYRQLQAIHNRSRVYSTLDDHFIKAAEEHHPQPPKFFPLQNGLEDLERIMELPESERYMNIPLGGGTFRRNLKYVPLLKRKRLESFEISNERWRLAHPPKEGTQAAPRTTRETDDDGNE